MKVVETDDTGTYYTWPPTRGKVYGIPVDEHLFIGDGFLWRRDGAEVMMQVIGVDATGAEGKRVFAVLD